ncbi:MAG: hypothetical protein MRY79_01765 [Alphaproteobacteria bacterium]|nr:hypothetical protein [Alphaproteobacteria bacterium]
MLKPSMKLVLFLIFVPVLSAPSWAMELDDAQICRAGISTVMDKKVEDVVIKRQQKSVIYLKFPIEENERTSELKCLVRGEQVIWATVTGRWRDSDLDSYVHYAVEDGILTVKERHKNGSIFTKKFDVDKLIKFQK